MMSKPTKYAQTYGVVADADRLKTSDMLLAMVEAELRSLNEPDGDLSYLLDVLRTGVRRSLQSRDGVALASVETAPAISRH